MSNVKLYLCDPARNTACKKRFCVTNESAPEWARNCSMTRHPEYAVLDKDGKPVIARPVCGELMTDPGAAEEEARKG